MNFAYRFREQLAKMVRTRELCHLATKKELPHGGEYKTPTCNRQL